MFRHLLKIIFVATWIGFCALGAQTISEDMNIPKIGVAPLQVPRETLTGIAVASLASVQEGTAQVGREVEEIPLQATVVRNDIEVKGSWAYRKKGALELWSTYYIYKHFRDKGGEEFYYLGMPAPDSTSLNLGTQIGWVNRQYLVDSPEALRTPNKIYRRVIVFDNRQENRVPIYAGPLHGAEELYKTPFFSFFYIYKETEDYYLIGVTPSIVLEDAAHDLLGWIHKKSCREWNTRLAVNYRPETQSLRLKAEEEQKEGLVRIYDTLENALVSKKESILAQESAGTKWKYNILRYPLLQRETVNQKQLFQVAFLSGSNSEEAQQILAQIREEKEKLVQLDIVLLLDASLSLSAREKITLGLNRLLKKLHATIMLEKAQLKLDIAWCVAYYYDFGRKKYPYQRGRLFQPQVVHLYEFTKDMDLVVKQIYNEPYRGDRYEPKAFYYGIDMAIQNIQNWRQGSSRCMIGVGLTGNHDLDSPRHIANDLNPQVIQEALQKNGIRFFGVQFEEPQARATVPAVQAFAKQTLQITKAMGQGGYFLLSPLEGDTRAKTFSFDMLLDMLIEQYRQEISILHEAISDLSRGFSPEEIYQRYQKYWTSIETNARKIINARTFLPQVVGNARSEYVFPKLPALMQSFIDRNNINFEDMKSKGIFYTKGWVWEFHPATNIPQIQVCLLVDKLELMRLMVFLGSLSRELKSASKPEQYIQIWKTLLKSMFGIDTIPANEPLDNLILQHSGLPFMNGLLTYTLDDFVSQARNPQFRAEIINKLDATCDQLNKCIEEKETEEVMSIEGIVVTQSKQRWWKELGSEMLYAWLEVELFP